MKAYTSNSIDSAHTLKPARRRFIASMLVTIYLMISLSPLASRAMYSRSIAHTVTNECSGDCNICGCSAESRAHGTCCCAKKKQLRDSDVSRNAKQCLPSQPEKPVIATDDCCSKSEKQPRDNQAQETVQKAETTIPETVYKCGSPCGKGKAAALAEIGSPEMLPYIYSERITLPHENTRYPHLLHRMFTRHAEPPDPPPKIAITLPARNIPTHMNI